MQDELDWRLLNEQRMTRMEVVLEEVRDDVRHVKGAVATLTSQADQSAGQAKAIGWLHTVLLTVLGGSIGAVMTTLLGYFRQH